MPQVHAPGRTAEVDWGEADVDLAGARTTAHLFQMRACFSGGGVRVGLARGDQQAFLEGHALGFDWFGGVFAEMRYDNLGSAVRKMLRGRRRVETDRFIALRSHYLFESLFTTPGIEGAHQKGGIEGEVGRFRRNRLVVSRAWDRSVSSTGCSSTRARATWAGGSSGARLSSPA